MSARVVLIAALLALSCSSATGTSTAGVNGSYDAALAGRFLFVTSSDRDELRVLDVAPPALQGSGRLFLTAPNPLEPLSIPVLPRPTRLSMSRRYDPASGESGTGAYLYVLSDGAAELSIVDADVNADGTRQATAFRELLRLPTTAPVTAASGFEVLGSASALFFSTYDGTRGTVFRLALPATAEALKAKVSATPNPLLGEAQVVASFDGQFITAVLAVPGLPARTLGGAAFCAGAEPCLAVGLRDRTGAGQTLLVEPSTSRSAVLAFPGAVRKLETHRQIRDVATGLAPTAPRRTLEMGERIFAVLDEAGCTRRHCGGVLAVDTLQPTGPAEFGVAKDIHGQPMTAITASNGVTTGFAIGTAAQLLVPPTKSGTGANGLAVLDAVGVLGSSNGELVYFDAAQLRHIDWDDPVSVVASWDSRDPAGSSLDPPALGPILVQASTNPPVSAVSLADGALESQSLVITWQGNLPGMVALPSADADGVEVRVPAAIASRARVGDSVILKAPAGDCAPASVTQVLSDRLVLDAGPANCTGRTSFTVRASGYVVQGALQGYMGRGAPGDLFQYFTDRPYFRPDTFDPAVPAIALRLGPEAPTAPAGSHWILEVDDNVLSYTFGVISDASVGGVGCQAQLPGGLVWDEQRARVFGAFPSANGVIELDPAYGFRGLLAGGNAAVCYR